MVYKTGKEFETLIDSHGPDHVQHLMQKVINALEQLERLASEKDKENSAVDSLQTMVEHLEVEENKKQEDVINLNVNPTSSNQEFDNLFEGLFGEDSKTLAKTDKHFTCIQ